MLNGTLRQKDPEQQIDSLQCGSLHGKLEPMRDGLARREEHGGGRERASKGREGSGDGEHKTEEAGRRDKGRERQGDRIGQLQGEWKARRDG